MANFTRRFDAEDVKMTESQWRDVAAAVYYAACGMRRAASAIVARAPHESDVGQQVVYCSRGVGA